MLYKPKFLSPALSAEQKCFVRKSDNDNVVYTFSCVCDGDEKIKKAIITLYDVNGKVLDKYDFPRTIDIDMYPINARGQYNLIELPVSIGGDAFAVDGKFLYWTVTLISESDFSVTSGMERTFIANPETQWTYKLNNTYVALDSDSNTNPLELKNNIINIKAAFNLESNYDYNYKIQYWYYEIYEENTNTLVYFSKKIFSQEIAFIFDEFLNKTLYRVELHIMDTVNQTWNTKRYIMPLYDVLESSATLDYKLLPFDSGVYLKWSNIESNVSSAKNGNIEDNFSIIEETVVDNRKRSQTVYCLNGINDLTVSNINLNTDGLYGCLRISEYPSSCKFEVYDYTTDNSYYNTFPRTQLIVQRESGYSPERGGNVTFKSSGSTGGNFFETVENKCGPETWYCFYWHFQTGKVAVKPFNSTVETTVTGFTELTENITTLNAGSYTSVGETFNPNLTIPHAATVNKLVVSGTNTELAYLFSVRQGEDSYTTGTITTTNPNGTSVTIKDAIIDTDYWAYLNKLNVQPYWNYGLASVYDIQSNGNFSIEDKDTELKNKFSFCLNFEDKELIANAETADSQDYILISKNRYLVGDPAFKTNITGFVVKRKELEETYFKTIATLDYNQESGFKLIDYGAVSGKNYQYALFPVSDAQYQSPIYSKSIEVDWDKWTLMVCDETDKENEFLLDQVYLFDLNIKSGSMTNNNKKTIIENFTPYPRVQSSYSCFWSGSLSGLLGCIARDSITYIQNPRILKEFKELSLSKKRKFLKDRDGNLFEIEISDALSIENTDNLIIDLKTKRINWVEVADATNASITLRDGTKTNWILTDYGYSNPLIAYTWNDGQQWIDNKFWTEGE